MALLIYGRNSVAAAIRNKTARKVYIINNFQDQRFLLLLKEKRLPIKMVDRITLNKLTNTNSHQGIAAEVDDYQYTLFDELIKQGEQIENPIILMLDGIEDPHNFGAILRIADAFNVVGIVIKKNNQVQLNATVAKVSTGAINYVKVSQVANLNNAISKLKEKGYWIIATDGQAKDSYNKIDYHIPIVLVIGSEGCGISKLVKDNSDFLVKIPMYGHVNSLNASNALSVILSHIINSRIPS